MYIKKMLLLVFLILGILACSGYQKAEETNTPRFPFPNHTTYAGIHIKPTNYSQVDLDNHVKSFYDKWRSRHLRNDCKTDEYYVFHGENKEKTRASSEGQGYGMMIMAFMAGYDSKAQTYFNGLYKYYKSHPSRRSNHLMDWAQINCSDKPSEKDNSASDGDIDIAFSLFLADKQWGSDGTVNYMEEANLILMGVMKDDINTSSWTIKLGDWVQPNDLKYYFGTRTSDFITSHFKTFFKATRDAKWDLITENCYSIISRVQNPSTGLVPDFIVNINSNPTAAPPKYLETKYDGDYYYNACRFPWRIGIDYLITGDSRAKSAVAKINTWLFSNTLGKADLIWSSYKLNGDYIDGYKFNDASFIGPFAVAAMSDTANQSWMNNIYQKLLTENMKKGEYFPDTIKLLSLISISENYWDP